MRLRLDWSTLILTIFEKMSALMWAAKKGSLETVKILLEYNADVNAKDDDGHTALYWAALCRDVCGKNDIG